MDLAALLRRPYRQRSAHRRFAEAPSPGGQPFASGKTQKPDQFARVARLDFQPDGAVSPLAGIEDEARRGHPGAADRADLQSAEIKPVGARLQVEPHVLRGHAH